MNAQLAAKLANRKNQYLEATAEWSDESLDQLALKELGQDSIDKLKAVFTKIDKTEKAAGIVREYDTSPKYEYGAVNGQIYKFISKWVYLRSELKPAVGVTIPDTAFTADDLESWGKLSRCSPLGTISEQFAPNLASVKLQIDLVKAYLDLPFTDEVMTDAEWSLKAERSKINAESKQARITLALQQAEQDAEAGLPVFTV